MEHKFKVGDRIIVTRGQDSARAGMRGRIVTLKDVVEASAPYGILFNKGEHLMDGHSLREFLKKPDEMFRGHWLREENIKLAKCKTCNGYGLLQSDTDTVATDRDLRSGLSTKPCPDCGADSYPIPSLCD